MADLSYCLRNTKRVAPGALNIIVRSTMSFDGEDLERAASAHSSEDKPAQDLTLLDNHNGHIYR